MNTVQMADAGRFLMQATLGANHALIRKVAKQGPASWLEQQLNAEPAPVDRYEEDTAEIWAHFKQTLTRAHGPTAINGEGNDPALPYKWYFRMAWWQRTLANHRRAQEHLVRQRVAQALSEILVISDNSVLELDAVGMASYYDLLYRHAFGSYTDLLTEVSLHPCMGVYLSHMNNRKAVPSEHIHPDENYAREIMQLFSIGLFDLNLDGSRKKDRRGRDIPSYHNHDIKELARVFTGLQAESYQYEWLTSWWPHEYNGYPVSFDDGVSKTYKTIPFVNMRRPMSIDEAYHDRGPKRLLDGHIRLPGKQDGKSEIGTVVERLVAHPNTAPFIAERLIQQLVTSNPSRHYVQRVASRFGKRGDLKAVVREILTYPLKNPVSNRQFKSGAGQMRKGEGKAPIQSQKLKSPLLRVTQILRAFGARNESGRLWLTGEDLQEMLSQHPLSSPTVFNFYKTDYSPHGPVDKAGLVAPEFELHTSATSIGYVNLMYYWFFGDYYPQVSTVISNEVRNAPEFDEERLQRNTHDRIKLDLRQELKMAADPARHDELIDHVSLLLTGKTGLSIKPRIKEAFASYQTEPLWVVQTVLFMIAISPEFTVLEA